MISDALDDAAPRSAWESMTPAGVKLVCVDINPAVVTKLADRGSIESAGVTDVGLFLKSAAPPARPTTRRAASAATLTRCVSQPMTLRNSRHKRKAGFGEVQ